MSETRAQTQITQSGDQHTNHETTTHPNSVRKKLRKHQLKPGHQQAQSESFLGIYTSKNKWENLSGTCKFPSSQWKYMQPATAFI